MFFLCIKINMNAIKQTHISFYFDSNVGVGNDITLNRDLGYVGSVNNV